MKSGSRLMKNTTEKGNSEEDDGRRRGDVLIEGMGGGIERDERKF